MFSNHALWRPDKLTTPLIVDAGMVLRAWPPVALCGHRSATFAPPDRMACWHTVSAEVLCMCLGPGGVVRLFENVPGIESRVVLAMATDPRSEAVCAVVDDGSLWCIGENRSGRFGTENDLLTETQVQPPGSVRIR